MSGVIEIIGNVGNAINGGCHLKRTCLVLIIALMVLTAAVAVTAGCEKNTGKKTEGNTAEDKKDGGDDSAEDGTVSTGKSSVSVSFIKGTEFVSCPREVEGGASGSLNELLVGPTKEEAAQGFQTAIPAGVKLNSYKVEGGVAKADFSSELLNYGGGSARVEAIIKQITDTVLHNDPSIISVEISVNGVPSGQSMQP